MCLGHGRQGFDKARLNVEVIVGERRLRHDACHLNGVLEIVAVLAVARLENHVHEEIGAELKIARTADFRAGDHDLVDAGDEILELGPVVLAGPMHRGGKIVKRLEYETLVLARVTLTSELNEIGQVLFVGSTERWHGSRR